MKIPSCLKWILMVVLMTAIVPVGVSAVTNKIGGKIVDRAKQQPLGEVKVVFHKVGDPSAIFDTVSTQTSGEKAGRYESNKIDRQNAWFAVQYTKDKYIEDARSQVGNDVFEKELDTVALVSIDAAVELEGHMVAGLRAIIRFVFVSKDVKRGQMTVDTLKRRGPEVFAKALKNNPDIPENLKKVGIAV